MATRIDLNSNDMETGDVSTLANPTVVGQIREMVQGKQPPKREEAPEDIRRFGTEG